MSEHQTVSMLFFTMKREERKYGESTEKTDKDYAAWIERRFTGSE